VLSIPYILTHSETLKKDLVFLSNNDTLSELNLGIKVFNCQAEGIKIALFIIKYRCFEAQTLDNKPACRLNGTQNTKQKQISQNTSTA